MNLFSIHSLAHCEWSDLFLSFVGFHMTLKKMLIDKNLFYLQVEVGEEGFIASFACESFYACVHFNMFVEVGLLGEWESTTGLTAHVGAFVRVDSQVVEEVVPLLELLAAFIALQDFHLPLWSWVFESEDSVVLGWRDMLFNPDRTQVEWSTCLHMDHDIPLVPLGLDDILEFFPEFFDELNFCIVITFLFLGILVQAEVIFAAHIVHLCLITGIISGN